MRRLVVAVAVAFACAAACTDSPQSHVYVAMPYEPAAACLDPSTTLAIIGTPDGSLLCAPTCLYEPSPPAVGGVKTWVSTMCGPYPPDVNTDGTDPSCAPALLAYANGAFCGGPTDGGAEGSGGDDSSADGDDGEAGEDASEGGFASEGGGDAGAVNDARAD